MDKDDNDNGNIDNVDNGIIAQNNIDENNANDDNCDNSNNNTINEIDNNIFIEKSVFIVFLVPLLCFSYLVSLFMILFMKFCHHIVQDKEIRKT